jgi:hypothetical protein
MLSLFLGYNLTASSKLHSSTICLLDGHEIDTSGYFSQLTSITSLSNQNHVTSVLVRTDLSFETPLEVS